MAYYETHGTVFSTLMRVGYAARGTVYILIGGIAVLAAFSGIQAEGSSGSLELLANQPAGRLSLIVIGLGITAYVAWRFADAALDLENKGGDASGFMARAGQAMSGLTHTALAVSAFSIAIFGGDSSGGAENLSARVLSQPFGPLLLGMVAITTVAVAFYLFYKAATGAHQDKIQSNDTTQFMDPIIRYGEAAHGFVLLIVGGLLGYAAVTLDPERAAGFGEALRILEQQLFWQLLLIAAAIGMFGFAAYCLLRTRFANEIQKNRNPSRDQ